MAKDQLAPLILCMESATGEDVAIQIEPNDDFQSFLDKAKLILGFDVDINSITKNQPVKLNENIYDFFINAEQEMQNDIEEKTSVIPEATSEEREDYIYILDDGTQIKASQADDNAAASSNPIIDANGQHTELIDALQLKENLQETNVTSSDESSAKSSPSTKSLSYIPNIPFKLVGDENPEFDTELSNYVNNNEKSSKNGSQSVLKPLEYIINSEEALTRDEVLQMFKDSPIVEAVSGVRTSPSADTLIDKPRRVRKTNPANRFPQLTKDLQKNSVDEANRCSLCQKLMSNESEVNRVTNVKMNPSTTIKAIVLCNECLNFNFSLFKEILGDVELSSDDYLVEKLDSKIIYKKRRNITSLRPHTDTEKEHNDSNNTIEDAKAIIEKIETELRKQSNGALSDDSLGFIKLELDTNGELLAKSIDDKGNYLLQFTKDCIKEEPFWTEKVESDFGEIECLESTEDQVMNFLETHGVKDYVCRLCSQTFPQLGETIIHSLQHHLIAEDVYPCILCEYGYKSAPELKDHMLTEHVRPSAVRSADLVLDSETSSPVSGPISARTRSASFKTDYRWPLGVQKRTLKTEGELDPVTGVKVEPLAPRIKKEIKEELAGGSEDDEGIWIVQTTSEPDVEGEDTLVQLLRNALDVKENFDNSELMEVLEGHMKEQKALQSDHRCSACNQSFTSASYLVMHACSKRTRGAKSGREATKRKGRRPKVRSVEPEGREEEDVIEIKDEDEAGMEAKPNRMKMKLDEDFQMEEEWIADDDDEDYIYEDHVRARPKRKKRETTSDPQVVSCRHCDQSFTSKVRLRFHLQFHEPPHTERASPLYICSECPVASRRSFDTEAALFDHVHFQHDKRKRWFCPEPSCGKTFYLRATLTRHCRMHTDTRRYRCDTCGKRFLDKQTLDEHSVSHLSIKPYQCHICLKQLTRRSRLRMHLRAHEDELAPRHVHVCSICDRAFKDTEEAEKHTSESSECLKTATENGPEQEPDGRAQQVPQELSADAQLIIRLVEIEKAFRCEFCEDAFYLEDALNEHRGQHRGVKNPYTCHICKVSFSTYSRCTTHKTTHGYYKKSIEEVKRRREGGVDEVKKEVDEPSVSGIVGYGGFPVVKHFLCETCNRSYLHWTYLQVHRRMKHAGENYTFKCKTCDAEFPNSWGVAYHRRNVHGKTYRQLTGRGSQIEARTSDGTQSGPHRCSECGACHTTKAALARHKRARHSSVGTRGLFACAPCGRRYAARAGLEAHARAHTGSERAFACGKCGVVFECVASLAGHVKMVHSGDMEYVCALCSKTFCSRTELVVHQRTHSADKPHVCPVCGHAFRTVSMRNEHLRIHTDERPFPCDICGVAFRRSTAMRNHRLIHTGERNYACARCPKRFRIRSDLRTHIRIKHPGQILVLEVGGLNPDPSEILEQLAINNISPSKIVDIKKISVPAGTVRDSSIFLDENSINVLSRMAARDADNESWTNSVLKAIGTHGRNGEDATEGGGEMDTEPQKIRRGRGIAKNPRKFRLYEGPGDPGDEEDEEDLENSVDQPTAGLEEYRIVVDQDLAAMHVLDGAMMVADENGGAQLIHIDEHGRLVDENGALLSLDGAVLRLDDTAVLDGGATLVPNELQLVESAERAAGVVVQQVEN